MFLGHLSLFMYKWCFAHFLFFIYFFLEFEEFFIYYGSSVVLWKHSSLSAECLALFMHHSLNWTLKRYFWGQICQSFIYSFCSLRLIWKTISSPKNIFKNSFLTLFSNIYVKFFMLGFSNSFWNMLLDVVRDQNSK